MSSSASPRFSSNRALDLVNFFVADVQTGFGPFVAVYLTTHKWTQVDIGFVLTGGTVASLVSQLPAGALIDAIQNKRLAASSALIGIVTAALLLAFLPEPLPVLVAEILHGFSSCVLTPAIAAISLHFAGHAALGQRLGRNARFASIGGALAAAVMGATGAYLPPQTVFLLTAALCVPALAALWLIRDNSVSEHHTTRRFVDFPGLHHLLLDRRLLTFAGCVILFHLSNAAMLPLAAAEITMQAGSFANIIIAASIMVPQVVVALLSPWFGWKAQSRGRRWLLLLGWGALPLRGLLLVVLPGSWPLLFGQAVSGVSAAAFGVLMPLVAADVTVRTPHFNLCMGILGLAAYVGAAISTAVSGSVADSLGMSQAFLMLTVAGVAAILLATFAMPETRPSRQSSAVIAAQE